MTHRAMPALTQPSAWPIAAAALVCAGAAASIAALGLPGAAAPGALAIAVIVAAALNRPEQRRAALLTLLLGVPLLLALLQKTTGASWTGAWQVVPLAMGLLGAAAFGRACRASLPLAGFAWATLLFVAWALASSALGRSQARAGLYQLASDLKPLLLVMLGFVVAWSAPVKAVLSACARWLCAPLMLLVAFEWIDPQGFFGFFRGDGFARASPDPMGWLPSRATGPYLHPSLLATTAAVFAILLAAQSSTESGARRLRSLALCAGYAALVVAAVQRQELAALLLALGAVFVLGARGPLFPRALAGAALLALAAAGLWLAWAEQLRLEFLSWGRESLQAVEHPRAQIMDAAWGVALQFAPFGAGLGAFGGAGAAKFDPSLYLELGFGSTWWFGREDFLLDTYWPNALAEAGFVGAGLLALSYALLIVHAAWAARHAAPGSEARALGLAATAACFYTLAISATSPAFQDPRLFLLPALLVGMAWSARTLAVPAPQPARAAGAAAPGAWDARPL